VTITIKSSFPPILGFFDSLLAILATVIGATAIVVTEHLEGPILDELFTAFLALNCHADILLHSSTDPPL
jgi:hypothetical protein